MSQGVRHTCEPPSVAMVLINPTPSLPARPPASFLLSLISYDYDARTEDFGFADGSSNVDSAVDASGDDLIIEGRAGRSSHRAGANLAAVEPATADSERPGEKFGFGVHTALVREGVEEDNQDGYLAFNAPAYCIAPAFSAEGADADNQDGY